MVKCFIPYSVLLLPLIEDYTNTQCRCFSATVSSVHFLLTVDYLVKLRAGCGPISTCFCGLSMRAWKRN